MAADPELIQLNIRIPPDVNEALEKAADAQRRSKNAQALIILEEWLSKQAEASPTPKSTRKLAKA